MRLTKDFRPSYLQYRKIKNTQKFWLAVFGFLVLLITSLWLTSCATANKSFIESERMYYDAVAPILRDYVNLDKQIKEEEKTIILETLDAWLDDLNNEVF